MCKYNHKVQSHSQRSEGKQPCGIYLGIYKLVAQDKTDFGVNALTIASHEVEFYLGFTFKTLARKFSPLFWNCLNEKRNFMVKIELTSSKQPKNSILKVNL